MTDKIDKECAVMIRFNALTLLNEQNENRTNI